MNSTSSPELRGAAYAECSDCDLLEARIREADFKCMAASGPILPLGFISAWVATYRQDNRLILLWSSGWGRARSQPGAAPCPPCRIFSQWRSPERGLEQRAAARCSKASKEQEGGIINARASRRGPKHEAEFHRGAFASSDPSAILISSWLKGRNADCSRSKTVSRTLR